MCIGLCCTVLLNLIFGEFQFSGCAIIQMLIQMMQKHPDGKGNQNTFSVEQRILFLINQNK